VVDPKTKQVTGSVSCNCDGTQGYLYGDKVAASFDWTVAVLDPVTLQTIRSATVMGDNTEMIGGWTVAGDDMWMLSAIGKKIYRVSLTTLKVTLSVPIPALTMEYLNGRLLTLDGTGLLQQVDTKTGKVVGNWQLSTPDKHDSNSNLDIFDDGTGNGVWVNELSTQLTHVDLTTGQIRTITGLPQQPEVNPSVLVANGVMWVSDWKDDLVLRMKP
jgi:hypothetical protein